MFYVNRNNGFPLFGWRVAVFVVFFVAFQCCVHALFQPSMRIVSAVQTGRLDGSFRFIRSLGVWYIKHINLEIPIISQAVGNCHSALRRGIQKTSKATNGAGCIHCTASGCGMTTASERGMTVTDRLARSCMLALIGFIFHTPKLRMNRLSHHGQPIPLPSGRSGGGFPLVGMGLLLGREGGLSPQILIPYAAPKAVLTVAILALKLY